MAWNPIACGKAIAKLSKFQDYDPRTWVKSCCWECMKKGKGANAFKKCLEKKMRKEMTAITNPQVIVDEVEAIWKKIKHKCS